MYNKRRAIAKDRAHVRKEAGKYFDVFKQMQGEKRPVEVYDECGPVDPELAKVLTAMPEPKPKKKKQAAPEGKVVRACLDLLAARGIYAWRNNSGAVFVGDRYIRYGKVGSADIIGLMPFQGQFLAIECKSKTGKQTSAQAVFQKHIEASGGKYLLVRSAAELKEQL